MISIRSHDRDAEDLTVTQRYQYAHPNAKDTESSRKRCAYSTNDPVTGMMVAISPRDCLLTKQSAEISRWGKASTDDFPHDEKNNNPHERETNQHAGRSAVVKRIAGSDEETRSDDS
jgi:hypothetical protein